MTDLLHAPTVMTETYDRVRRAYGAAIGQHRARAGHARRSSSTCRPPNATSRAWPTGSASCRPRSGRTSRSTRARSWPGSRSRPAPSACRVATVWEAIVLVALRPRPHLRRQHGRRPAQDPGAGRARPRRRRDGRRRRRRQRRAVSAAARAAGQSSSGVLVEVDTGHGPLRRRHARRGARPGPPRPRPAPALRLLRRDRLRGPLLADARARTAARPRSARRWASSSRSPSCSSDDGIAVSDPLRRRDGDLGLDRGLSRASPRSRPARTWSWTTSTAGWSAGSSTR